jgi:transcriptional regulator with XRE-family HTH domain
MSSLAEIYDLIEERRLELGLSQAEVSERAGGTRSSAALQSMRRGSWPSAEKLRAIADVLGLEFRFGRPEQGEGFSETQAVYDQVQREALRQGYAPIPWHDRCRQAEMVPVAFSRAWMLRHDIEPEGISAIRPATVLGMGQGAEAIAIVRERAPRQGGPDLWCYFQGRTSGPTVGYLQFDRGKIIRFGARLDAGVDLFEHGSVELLGRVLWHGTFAAGLCVVSAQDA